MFPKFPFWKLLNANSFPSLQRESSPTHSLSLSLSISLCLSISLFSPFFHSYCLLES